MSFIISGIMRFDPAQHDAIASAMHEVASASQGEDGCHTYGFTAVIGEPGAFRIFEHWDSDAALDAHFQQPHYLEFIGSIGGWGLTGADVNRYEVSEISSMTGG
jgi:quinol monooxygenase YgiN